MSKQRYYLTLYFRQGMELLWRNRFWSVVTGLVISLLLFVVYVSFAMSAHTAAAAKKVDDRLVITALIAQDKEFRSITPPEALRTRVAQLPNVKSVRIVSEKETQKRFLDNVKGLQSPPSSHIFNDGLEISVYDVQRMAQVRDEVARIPGVQRADYLAELARKLTAVSGYLEQASLGATLLLGFVALLVVTAVVRTSIHSEQRSVATMTAVGGSVWTIAAPLIIHMIAIVLVSATIACLGGWLIDPHLGGSFGKTIRNLPAWLQTGRAYSLFELWPPMVLVSSLVVSLIVAYGTRKYARQTTS
jgi:cell division protein FtsX